MSILSERELRSRSSNVMRKRMDKLGTYAFILPGLIIYLSVIILPIFYSVFISMHKWSGVSEMEFVGFQNYSQLLLRDNVFHQSLVNNLIWIGLTILLTPTVSLALAVLLTRQFSGRTFFRGVFYFPAIIAPIIVATMWRWVYDPNLGFLNHFSKFIGSDFKQSWLSNPDTSLLAVFAASLWQSIGQPMILFMAGLQTVPGDILEASSIDGANPVQKFFRVTLPMMRETIIIVLATQIIAAMKVYDIVKGLTDGGPINSTQMLATYMYSQTFEYNNVGYGTAIAVLMVVFMLIVIIPYIRFTAKED